MKQYKILSLIGPDRPGIVDEVSSLLYEYDANIEDSRMATLGGCFSIMALFSFEAERFNDIQDGLQAMEKKDVQISLYDASYSGETTPESSTPFKLKIQAMDHPGIVQKVVHLLHQHDVNITSLQTHVIPAPVSGSPLFDLELSADLPVGVTTARISTELSELASREDLDVDYL